MSAFIGEWVSLLLRWLHFIVGIAWIGASLYFVWVENALVRGGKQRSDSLAGHLWAIHGGGFYYLEKYKSAPAQLPPVLHWFKWEAYATWLSGMALMLVVYYVNAEAWLVAPESGISGGAGIVLSLSLMLGGLAAYVVLCSTPLLERPFLLGLIGLAAAMGMAWALPALFTARASFLHVGAIVGTIMVANVLMVIIPSQKRLVASVETGEQPDPQLVRKGSLRSVHNNYLVLPVLLLMVSSHYPLLYESERGWIALGAIWVAGVYARHFFNCQNRGEPRWRWAGVATAAIVVAAAATVPPSLLISPDSSKADFDEVQRVIAVRCTTCHSANPSDDLFREAPLGFKMDTVAEIRAQAAVIYQRTAVDRSMPFANKTKMTEEERALIAAWYASVSE